jgi:polysaccharide transporter, PST family
LSESDISKDLRLQLLSTPSQAESLMRNTIRGSVFAIVAQVIRIAIQLVGAMVMARLLEPNDFGLVAMATTVTVFVSIFTDMGLSTATIQRKEITHEIVSILFFLNLAVGFGLMLLAVAASPLAAWLFHDARVGPLVLSMALGIPMASAAAQHSALMSRGMRWIPLQAIGIVAQSLGLIVGILLAWKTSAGYWAIVAQGLTSSFVSMALTWVACPWRPSRPKNWHGARSEINFGLYLTGFGTLNYFHRQGDNALIGWQWGAVELGYYSRAYNLLMLPINLINSSVTSTTVPMLSRLKDKPDEWNRAFLHLATVTAFAGVGICVCLFVVARPLITLLLGPKWVEVISIFQILSISSIFATSSNSCGWIFVSLGKTKEMFKWSLFASPLFFISFLIGLPWGAQGVALSYAIMMLFLVPAYYYYSTKQCSLTPSTLLKWIVPIYGIASVSALCGYFSIHALELYSNFQQFALGSFVTGTVYLAAGILALRFLPQYHSLTAAIMGYVGKYIPFRTDGHLNR